MLRNLQLIGLATTWIIMHTLFWDGKLSRDADVPLPIRIFANLFNAGEENNNNLVSRHDDPFQTKWTDETAQDPAQDRLNFDSLDEISYNGLFNFFADPNPSFRNLIMNTGFVTFQLILWFLPTFFWPGEPLPTPATTREGDAGPIADERFGSLIQHFSESSPVAVYNRLLCPQCVTQTIAIATLLVKYRDSVERD